MALPNRLRQARLTNADAGERIDNGIGDLEVAIADIGGYPLDTDISAAAIVRDAAGRITNRPRIVGAVGTNGIRLRDSDNDSECLLTVEDGYLAVYDNTGTEAAPIWTYRNKMNLLNGAWQTASAAAGVEPVVANMRSFTTQSIPNDTWTDLVFTSEAFDNGGLIDIPTNNDRMIIPTGLAGGYIYEVTVRWAANSSGDRELGVSNNGFGDFLQIRDRAGAASSGWDVKKITGVVLVSDGNYLLTRVKQTSGSALDVYAAEFQVSKIS